MTTVALLDPHTGTVTVSGKHHTDTFDVDDLPAKLALYRSLRDRAGGKYAQHYAPRVEALEQLLREVQG